MTVESASYISQLNAALPSAAGAGDPVGEGDDHLRLLKAVLKATFPAMSGPVTLSQTTLNALPGTIATGDSATLVSAKAYADAQIAASLLSTLQAVYPVDSIFISMSSANPSSVFGFGTWTNFGQGRVMIGVGTGTDDNAQNRTWGVGQTEGEYRHTLTIGEIPPHGHPQAISSQVAATAQSMTSGGFMMNTGNVNITGAWNGTPSQTLGQQIGGTGGGADHQNLPPVIAVYFFRRIA